MNRMNMKAEDRQKNATEEMEKYFVETYGPGYKDILYKKLRWSVPYNK